MSEPQAHRPKLNWDLFRVIGASMLRTVAGFIAIMWALSLVPETADYTLWRPIAIVIFGVAVYIYFFIRQLRRVENSKYPAVSGFEALILVAAMFLAFFAAVYVMMSASDPSSFSEPLDHFNSLYFALTVLATVGFGDITPVQSDARMVCMVQMAIDIVFIAVVIRAVTSAAQNSAAYRRSVSEGKPKSIVADL
ncbi:MAG: potassium channel family protein [Actinomycetota bacterium]|nr:potassium channel family protein [Actinomycetota bacterium]